MTEKAKSIFDAHLERFVSRKFLAWAVATGLAFSDHLTSEDWVAVTMAYIGTQALVDAATSWKHGKD